MKEERGPRSLPSGDTTMIISIIAALAENRVIGHNGAIPWDIPEDRRRFRDLTMGHPVIMGRKTYEAIGHPLPGRRNIVITKDGGFRDDGCLAVNDLSSALAACAGNDEVFICGGGEIYREALPLAKRLYLTLVPGTVEGDASFPEIPEEEFEETERRQGQEAPYCTFVLFVRRHRT
jgi:dihydrofolate reductase